MRWLHVPCGCLIAVMVFCGHARGQTDAHWLSATSGNWTDAARWSTGPAIPNNGGGNTYNAVVDAAGGPYTITLITPITVNGLTLDSAGATVQQTSAQTNGALTLIDGLVVNAGSFLVTAGAVTTPSLSGAGLFSFDGGNAGTQALRSVADGTLTIAAGTTVRTLTGSGTVGRDDATVVNNGVLVAEAGHGLTVTGDHWVNNGTLRVDGGSLALNGTVATGSLGTIVNTGVAGGGTYVNGTIENIGATLALTPTTGSMTLNGTGRIVGGTISGVGGKGVVVNTGVANLDGVTVAGSGLAVAGSGVLQVVNGLTLASATVPVGDTGSSPGTLQFAGDQTLGGTGELQFGNNGVIKPTAGTLTIGAGVTIHAKTSSARLGDVNFGLVNKGAIVTESTTRTLDVTGSSFDNQGTIGVAGGSVTLTNVTNTGALSQTGGVLSLLGAWHNPGTITLTNGTLNLGGTFATADVGVINHTGGTVRIAGTMDLSAAPLALTAATGSWVLTHNGRLKNGSITTAGGAALTFDTTTGPGGVFDNVTVASDLTLPTGALLTVQNGLTLANKSITVTAATSGKPTSLTFDGTQTLGGTGEIVLSGPYGVVAGSAGTLTIGPGVTIRTAASGGQTVGTDTLPLINQGTISGTSNGTMNVRGSGVTNFGTIASSTGGRLTVFNLNNLGTVNAAGAAFNLNGAWHNAGTIVTTSTSTILGGTFAAADIGTFTRTGGNLFLDGLFDNTGNTLDLGARFNGPVTLLNTITGGTVVGSTAAPLTISADGGSRPTLDGVTLNTDVTVTGAFEWLTRNGLTVAAGRKVISNAGGHLGVLTDETIAGGGEFQFTAPSGAIDPHAFVLTLSAGTTVKSAGANGGVTIGSGFGSVVNNGLIVASSPAGYVSLVGNVTNLGTIRVEGGMLNLGGVDSLANWGTLERNGGSVNYIGVLNNAGKTLDLSATPVGAIDLGMGALVYGGTLTSGGGRIPKIVRPDPSTVDGVGFTDVTLATSLDIQAAIAGLNGTFTMSGNPTVRIIGAAGTTSGFAQSGPVSISGAGTITFENAASSDSHVRSSGALTIGPGITIKTVTGAGNVSGTTVNNQGLLSAGASGKNLIVDGALTNTGTIEARSGGTLYVQSSVITNLANNTLTGGTWAAYAGSTLLFNNKTFATNAANVLLDGSTSVFAAVAPLSANGGTFAIDHGRSFTTAGALANSGTLRVGTGSLLTVKGALTNTGEIEGNGTIVANVTSSGVVSPGASPGTLTIGGSFAQTASGILDVEIGGTNAGVDYDVLKVTGSATLAGTLRVTLLNGYVPPAGAGFAFLQSASGSVAFDQVLLPPEVPWDTAALAAGRIAVVPEPGIAAVSVVLLALARRRRRALERGS